MKKINKRAYIISSHNLNDAIVELWNTPEVSGVNVFRLQDPVNVVGH